MRKPIFLLFLALCTLSYGQHNVFISIGQDDAFQGETVKPIFRDSKGYMWFGILSGVCRYDGYNTKTYKIEYPKNAGTSISWIDESKDGRIMMKAGNDLYVYSFEEDCIHEMRSEILLSHGLPDGDVFLDGDKNIWVDAQDGLYCHLSNQDKNIAFEKGIHIKDLCSANNIIIILADDGRFFKADLVREKMVPLGQMTMSEYEWHYIFLDKKNNLWFYTAHSPIDGLKCYSLSENRWIDLKGIDELKGNIITSVSEDGNGKIWIGTEDEGIFVYDLAVEKSWNIKKTSPNRSNIMNNHISRIYNDGEDRMWVSFYDKGVSYTVPDAEVFNYLYCDFNDSISCISEDSYGNIWIGSDGDGVMMADKDGNTIYLNKDNEGIDSDIVTCLFNDSKNNLWAGTFGSGIQKLEGGRFKSITFNGAPSHLTAYIKMMDEDCLGNLWLSSFNGEIICVNKDDGTTRVLNDQHTAYLGKNIHCMAADKDGLMFIGSSHGLHVYDCIDDKFIDIFDKSQSLRELQVKNLAIDNRGLIWIGTDFSVLVFNKKTGETFRVHNENPSLPIKASSITADDDGSVWITTDKGIVRITQDGTAGFTYGHYACNYGENAVLIKKNASACTSDGIFITNKGNSILGINPATSKEKTIDGEVTFTGLSVNGTNVAVGDETGILGKNIGITESIRLKHGQNNIKISLSILDIGLKDLISYEYRIRENGNDWFLIENNEIILNQLPYGTMLLEARATDNWEWYSNTKSLKITVSYPWWRSPLMIFVVFMTLSGLVLWFLSKVKNNLVLKEQLAKQKEMDENKMRFITNINHDIRTPLSLIISPLERVLKKDIDDDTRQDLELSYRNAESLLEEFNQLIDVTKLEEGAESLHLSHGDIVSYSRSIVSSYTELASSESIQLYFKSDEAFIDTDFDRTKIRRILLNLISNAVKYNQPGGTVTVSVTKESDKYVKIDISDTGSGISDKDKALVFNRFFQCNNDDVKTGSGIGLHIVKEYTELHGGTVSVSDNVPTGACFTIVLPIKNEISLSEADNNRILRDSPLNRNKTILIVEDNKEFNEFLKKCLQDDYNIMTATNGREALEIMSISAADMVISDVMMPQMDGYELCKYIKSHFEYSHIPVILLTAKSRDEDVIQGLSRGADDYISKPFNLDILRYRIQKIFEWTENVYKRISKGVSFEPSEITVSSLDEAFIEKCVKTVEKHINDDSFSVEELGREIGLTRGHLYKKLMFITGKSPVQFIRLIRIKRGKALLEQGRTRVAEVAYDVGFSPKQFSKHFKEIYGCLPSEFLSESDISSSPRQEKKD